MRWCLLAGFLISAACGPFMLSSSNDLQLSVDRDGYRAGDTLTVILTNRSGDDVGYNLCTAAFQERRGGQWAEGRPLAEVCTMELRILAPEASASFRHRLPAPLAAGEYRVSTGVESPLGGDRVVVVSDPFRVVQ